MIKRNIIGDYMNKKLISIFCFGLLCCGCSNINNPDREPYPGFHWKNFQGAGLSLKVQENDQIKFSSNSDNIFIQSKDGLTHPVIKVYNIENNNINSLLHSLKPIPELETNNNWFNIQNCEFTNVKQHNNSKIFILSPKGQAKIDMEKLSPKEPIPYTCGGYGVGNSGARYFITFDRLPNKAVFVEIGQDAPLFDEYSINPIN